MREISFRGIFITFIMVFLAITMLIFSLSGQTPITYDNQHTVFIVGIIAVFAEVIAKPMPSIGYISTGTVLYFFSLFILGTVPAALITAGATLVGAIIKTIIGDSKSFLSRIAFAAQTVLLIGGLGFILEKVVSSYQVVSQNSIKGVFIVGLPYLLLDMMIGTILVSQFLDQQLLKDWAHSRNKALALTAVSPLLGYIGALFYHASNKSIGSLILLGVVTLLLHFLLPSFVSEEKNNDPIYELLNEMDKVKDKEKQLAKKCDTYRKKLERKEEELLALLDFSRSSGTELSLENAIRVIFDVLRKLFRYQTCIIFETITVGEESYFVTFRHSSPYGEYCKNLYIKHGETIVGEVAEEKKPLLIVDEKEHEGPQRLLEYEKSEMAVPLVVQDKIRWVIYIGQKEEKIYTNEDLRLFTLLAYQAAVFLVYAKSYEDTVSLATTDGLTGLYTHRCFQERLAEEVKRAERYRLPLSLVMIDVDHFKSYNDTYGHPKGDTLLKDISQILRSYTRDSDIDCRYAGDEFSLILIETTKENAVTIAERIRDAMVQRLNAPERQVRITGSFGVASFPEDAKNKAELITHADDALYNAKKERNKVVAYVTGMSETAHSETKDKDVARLKTSAQTEIKILRKESERKT